jgi:hypothetical protein
MLRTSVALTLLSTLLSGGLFDETEHRRGQAKSTASQPNSLEPSISSETQQIEIEARLQVGRDLLGRK